MRAEEIREMAREDMVARVRELEEERFRLEFRSATEPLEDPLRLRVIRRDIARLKTVLRETAGGGAGVAASATANVKTTAKSSAKPAAKAKASAKTGGKRRTNA
jgi:large subunit ribosomal protein L29